MPWTNDEPPKVAKNWTPEQKSKCVEAGNAALKDGASDEEAIFACIAAAGKSKGEFSDDFWINLADAVCDLLGIGGEDYGGPGSGHWAHKGVPGQRGGSVGGGGLVRIGATAGHSPLARKAMSQKTRAELLEQEIAGKERSNETIARGRKAEAIRQGGVDRMRTESAKGLGPAKQAAAEAAHRQKMKGKGTSKPVSDGLDLEKVPKKGKIGPPIREAIHEIDSVHGDGDLPGVPVKVSSSNQYAGSYFTQLGDAHSIEVSRKTDTPRIAATHEIGHYLDHQAIGEPGRYHSNDIAALVQGGKDPSRGHAEDAAMAKWWKAADNSDGVHELRSLSGKTVTVDNGIYLRDYHYDSRYISYATEPSEVFARSYSQYITTKSGNKSMLKELNQSRTRTGVAHYPTQWADDDFAPISAAFDDLMVAKGWNK